MVGIVLLFVFVPCPSSSQYGVFRAVLAIALAGFAAVIPGFLKVQHKQMIQAGGALAVFVLAYFLDPASGMSSDNCNQPFTLTVFVQGQDGSRVLRDEGKLLLAIPGDLRKERIDGDGKAAFIGLPARLADDSTQVELEAEGWQFTNGRKTTRIALADPNPRLTIERDASLCCVSGSVRDGNGFIEGARVSVRNDMVETDENGRFELELSSENQQPELRLTVVKEGYQLWEDAVYPATKADLSVVLERK